MFYKCDTSNCSRKNNPRFCEDCCRRDDAPSWANDYYEEETEED